MVQKSLDQRIKESPNFRDEVLELVRVACKDATTDSFEALYQKLDEITFRLDLILEKLDRQDQQNGIIPISSQLPKRIES